MQNPRRRKERSRLPDVHAVRVINVLHYIQRNLSDELSLERLSRVARISRFHFHRQFSTQIGVAASRVVRLLRLKRASFQLIFEKRPSITAIAFDAGFENAESF